MISHSLGFKTSLVSSPLLSLTPKRYSPLPFFHTPQLLPACLPTSLSLHSVVPPSPLLDPPFSAPSPLSLTRHSTRRKARGWLLCKCIGALQSVPGSQPRLVSPYRPSICSRSENAFERSVPFGLPPPAPLIHHCTSLSPPCIQCSSCLPASPDRLHCMPVAAEHAWAPCIFTWWQRHAICKCFKTNDAQQ